MVVAVVVVAVVVEVRVVKFVKLVISVYFFDIFTSKKKLKTLSFLHF